MMLWQTAIDALTETWQIDCFVCIVMAMSVVTSLQFFVKQVQHNTVNAA